MTRGVVAYLLLVRLGPLRSSMTHATASTAFEGALERYGRSQQMGVGQEDDLLSQRPAEYRPHRPHRHECSDLQGFLTVGTAMSYRLPWDGYRPPRQVPTAYHPHRIPLFCRYFSAFGLSRPLRAIVCELNRWPVIRVGGLLLDETHRSAP